MGWSDLGGLLSGAPSPSTVSTLTPQQRRISQALYRYMQPRIGQGLPRYPGQLVAGLSPYEQQGLGYLQQYLGGMGQYMPQRQAAYAKALGGEALAPIDMSASKQWFEQQVVPQYRGQFQQLAAPAAEQARAMMGGKSSSAMNRALSETAGGMSRYLGDVGYEFMRSEEQAKRQREEQNLQYQLAAMAATEPERAEQLQMTQAAMQYGYRPWQRDQMELEAEMNEWMRTQPEYSPFLQMAMNYIQVPMQAMYMKDNPGMLAKWSGAWNELGYAMSAPFQAFTMPAQSANAMQSAGGGMGGMWGSIQGLFGGGAGGGMGGGV